MGKTVPSWNHVSRRADQNRSSKLSELPPKPRKKASGLRGSSMTPACDLAVSTSSLMTCSGSVPCATPTGISTRRQADEKVQLITWFEIKLLFGAIASAP